MELFRIGFLTVSLVDLIDIGLVCFLAYRLFLVMRGTIAAQILLGLGIIVGFSFVVQALHLQAMSWILRTLTDIWVIAFIILFQPELRRLLVMVGRNPAFRFFLKLNVEDSIDAVVDAVTDLSKRKQGALIVFVRATGIRMIVETGTPMEALVSKSLLLSIFNPRSPLHDGAVVIKDRTIEAARCTLPLSGITTLNGQFLGTRHRAGLGVSEQADVVVVIVSEETGGISLAEGGELRRGFSPATLRKDLKDRLSSSDQHIASLFRFTRASS